jgi:pantothenate kinase
LAVHLVAALKEAGVAVAHVPMDGFHLADASLAHFDALDRKGAIDTFDAHGFLSLLRRVRSERGHTIYAPDFERNLEQPLAGAIRVGSSTSLVITEGNYFLAPVPPWPAIRAAMDQVWYCDLPTDTRTERLVARHTQFGKSPDQAADFVAQVDQANAKLVTTWRDGADSFIDLPTLDLSPVGAS